jgi:hypothetical protein
MWSKIQNNNPVWYFDATGSVLKHVDGQKSPFFYSMVMHDKKTKSIIPVFEFLTTSQTITTISQYLTLALSYINKNMNSYWGEHKSRINIAPIIVTDFSWALINSVNQVFNGMSFIGYLNYCYEILIKEKRNECLKVRLHLCSVHFLKVIIKHINPSINSRVKKAFLFSFTLLQNCSTIEEFETVLYHIFQVFNTKQKTNYVINSLDYLRTKIFKRNLHLRDISGVDNVFQLKSSNQTIVSILRRTLILREQ